MIWAEYKIIKRPFFKKKFLQNIKKKESISFFYFFNERIKLP